MSPVRSSGISPFHSVAACVEPPLALAARTRHGTAIRRAAARPLRPLPRAPRLGGAGHDPPRHGVARRRPAAAAHRLRRRGEPARRSPLRPHRPRDPRDLRRTQHGDRRDRAARRGRLAPGGPRGRAGRHAGGAAAPRRDRPERGEPRRAERAPRGGSRRELERRLSHARGAAHPGGDRAAARVGGGGSAAPGAARHAGRPGGDRAPRLLAGPAGARARRALALAALYRDRPLDFYFAGEPIVSLTDLEQSAEVARRIPITFAVIALMLLVSFRDLQGMLIPMLTAALSTVWGLGIMARTGIAIDSWNVAVPILLIAVAAAHSA